MLTRLGCICYLVRHKVELLRAVCALKSCVMHYTKANLVGNTKDTSRPCPLFFFRKSADSCITVRTRQKNLASRRDMAPTQPQPSGSWSPSKKAAVTLGIILGLVLVTISLVALCKLLKKYVTRWIKDELAFDRYRHICYREHSTSPGRGAQPGHRLSSSSMISGLSTSTPPPVLQSRLAPSQPLREPHYYPRHNAMARTYYPGSERADSPYHAGCNQIGDVHRTRHHGSARAEHPEPRSLEEGSEKGFSWVAGDERMEYRPPYATSASASAEDESPHGTTSRADRARSRGSLPVRDV